MRKASWIILVIVGALIILGGLGSAGTAYRGQETFGELTLEEVAAGRENIAELLRGRRGTAAAYAVAFGALFTVVAAVPYRRGDVWSWWALFGSLLALFIVVVLRLPLVGTRPGIVAAALQLGIGGIGLLLDVRRLKR